PDGSQAFVPMSHQPFLVVMAKDKNGIPQNIRAFLTEAGQAINIHRGVWHGVLTPLAGSGLFAVIDRIGPGANLEEHHLADPWTVG
ncbi:MAG: ureidoglycolate lyase, partial [Chthoniobacterales bacterium]